MRHLKEDEQKKRVSDNDETSAHERQTPKAFREPNETREMFTDIKDL